MLPVSVVGNSIGLKPIASQIEKTQNTDNKVSFTETLNKAVVDLNNQQVEAYQSMQDIATGKVDNLQKAVQQIEEAELTMKLALEVKNKVIGSTKQILQMQI